MSKAEQIESAMLRARDYAIAQFNSTTKFINSIDLGKPIHIGETGWANHSNGFYGPLGSKATDEYKQGIYLSRLYITTNHDLSGLRRYLGLRGISTRKSYEKENKLFEVPLHTGLSKADIENICEQLSKYGTS